MGNRRDRIKRRGGDLGAGIRVPRLELLLHEELNSLLDTELQDPRFDGTRVTRVELSGDGSRARIWFCVHQNAARAEQAHAAFERAAGFLRARLCDALPLKRTPELSFRLDPAAWLERPTFPE